MRFCHLFIPSFIHFPYGKTRRWNKRSVCDWQLHTNEKSDPGNCFVRHLSAAADLETLAARVQTARAL